MLAFLGYQTDEKAVAGHVAKLLGSLGIDTFTASRAYRWRCPRLLFKSLERDGVEH